MLTFEKVLEVFQAYLDDDPLYEVVQTSHGYTLMAWEPHRNDWYSAEIQKTPEDLRNALLDTYPFDERCVPHTAFWFEYRNPVSGTAGFPLDIPIL